MRVAGVVAEYNPFHLGHAFHLAETWRRLGAEGCGGVRHEAAIGSRGGRPPSWTNGRGRSAPSWAGADLVLELPTWAVSFGGGVRPGREWRY